MLEKSQFVMTLENSVSNFHSEPKNWVVSLFYNGNSNIDPNGERCVPQVDIICLKLSEINLKIPFCMIGVIYMCIELQLGFC